MILIQNGLEINLNKFYSRRFRSKAFTKNKAKLKKEVENYLKTFLVILIYSIWATESCHRPNQKQLNI